MTGDVVDSGEEAISRAMARMVEASARRRVVTHRWLQCGLWRLGGRRAVRRTGGVTLGLGVQRWGGWISVICGKAMIQRLCTRPILSA